MLGNPELLAKHKGYGYLLAHLRNLPEMHRLYGDKKNDGYCFKNGSRGRGNGQSATSPLGGSNIWLADEYECVIISQTDEGRGPLKIDIYLKSQATHGPMYLSRRVLEIIRMYDLPRVESGAL